MPPPDTQPTTCLFAQYHPSGHIPAHTRYTLTQLARCGLRLHVACSGATAVAPHDQAFLATIGATALPRPNAGLDFGAWADLLRAGHAAGAPRVIFANDSVFGPFADLRPLLAAMDARGADAWGMVESRERMPHLQSWFLNLTAHALAAAPVQRVFAQDFAAMGKEAIILHGELGLSAALREAGLSTTAAWPETMRLRRLLPVNPAHFDWRGMLTTGAVPFIKAELLRDNPANIAWLPHYRGILATMPLYDPAQIDPTLAAPPLRPTSLARRLLNITLTRDRPAALRSLFGM
jgi:lipopolysaccharide biosynthesis protein